MLALAMTVATNELLTTLHTTPQGPENTQVEESRIEYGDNNVTPGKKLSLQKRIAGAFINPFTAILFVLAGILGMVHY